MARLQRLSKRAARERVTRGIALLDATDPKWREKVDPNFTVEHLESFSCCVLGQAFGSFNIGLRETGLSCQPREGFATLGGTAGECGFTLPLSEAKYGVLPAKICSDNWQTLADAWKEALQ